eukprot:TRINITY_DN67063_c1_g4_i1.p1 TRINITY_DN67063_c1_g4~~TRINITY_DN67063_c1_g4_i1.p1  ORF type:complete len:114 (-),score=14.08 TRINITY_DN67063_c1_g4_i1:807-1121(-)
MTSIHGGRVVSERPTSLVSKASSLLWGTIRVVELFVSSLLNPEVANQARSSARASGSGASGARSGGSGANGAGGSGWGRGRRLGGGSNIRTVNNYRPPPGAGGS